MVLVLFSRVAWSRFGHAYSNALSSLRNMRGAVSIRDEQRSLFSGKRQLRGNSGKRSHGLISLYVCRATMSTKFLQLVPALECRIGGEKDGH